MLKIGDIVTPDRRDELEELPFGSICIGLESEHAHSKDQPWQLELVSNKYPYWVGSRKEDYGLIKPIAGPVYLHRNQATGYEAKIIYIPEPKAKVGDKTTLDKLEPGQIATNTNYNAWWCFALENGKFLEVSVMDGREAGGGRRERSRYPNHPIKLEYIN